MLKFTKSLFLFLILNFTLLLFPQGLQAQGDPRIEWREIETNEAYWLYDAKHQELVEYYIWQFNKAKVPVNELFKEASRKMTIIISDHTDQANGSARVSPHPYITIFPVAPSSSSSIGEFKDNVHEILIHEYTHILNMEPVHGWMSPLYWIFGSIAHPNMVLPRWYTEGLAVYTESKFSKEGGRLNSQFVEGLARSLTLEEKWSDYPLSQINDHHFDWLGATRAYVFGGMLWDSIVRDSNINTIYEFNQSYSRRVPYFLDGVISDKIHRSYDEQLKRAYSYWNDKALQQIETVTTQPQITGRLLRKSDATDLSPSISPDGLWMVFLSNDNEGQGHINIILRHPKKGFLGYKPIQVATATRAQSLAWHPAGTGFVYEKLDQYDFYYRYNDLYFYDLRTRKSQRLTRGARAHHSCFSPKGDYLYYLQYLPGTKQITAYNIKEKKTEVLYKGKIGDDLKFLSCPSKNFLLTVEQNPGNKPHIAKINLTTHEKTIFFKDVPVNYMKWTNKGLLFSSDTSGIENLYLAINPESPFTYKAITNSKTRAIQGDIDPLVDELYYSQLTADGPKIFTLKGAQWESLPDRPPQVSPIVDYTSNETSEKKEPIQPEATESRDPASDLKSSSFSPWRYMYPNHWIPFLFVIPRGTLYQASTSAGDPLGKNTYSIIGQWDTLTRKAGVSASYFNNSLPVTLGFGGADVYTYFYSTDDVLHFQNFSSLINWRLWFNKKIQTLLKFNFSRLSFTNNELERQGPQVQVSYSDVKRKGNQIAASSGWNAQLGHKAYLSSLATTAYDETYAHLGTFWSSFLPTRHALSWEINGSYAPLLNNTFFATSTLAGPFQNLNNSNTSFLQRGYPTGTFIAKNIANTNLEYHFPLFSVFRGWTGPPLFFKNLQGSFVFDATTLDGRYTSSKTKNLEFTEFGRRWYTGYGMELHSNMNVGFHVPIKLTLGLYYGEDRDSFGGFTTFFNVTL
jgi:hypothetical protein